MADWNKKYYYSFRSVDNVKYTVEIWQDIPTGDPLPVAMEITGDQNPAILQYNADSLFTPVRGSGAELTLLSTSDRMFTNLYTPDMQLYQVRIYRSLYADELIWVGYLDSENYSEPFDQLSNYPVSVTANDGFNLLSRMSFLDTDGSKHTGVSSMWVTLIRVIQKLNLTWQNIYVGLSYTIPEVTIAADKTLLDYLYVNNENYYNEDGEPETCRTVLENLLNVLGAFIIQKEGSLYITDSNFINAETAAYKKFDYVYELTAFDSEVTLYNFRGDISTLKLQSSNISMQIENGINKQVVKYNHYSQDELIKFDAASDFSTAGAATTRGAAGYSWTETEWADSKLWTKYNNGKFCSYVGAETVNEDKKDTYLKISSYGLTGQQYYSQLADETRHSFKYKLTLPSALTSQNFYLRIEMSIYARTTDNLGETPTIGIKAVCLTTRLKIGDKKYTAGAFHPSSTYSKWVDAATATTDLVLFFRNNTDDYNNFPINDTWVPLDVKVPYSYFQDGILKNSVELRPYLIPLNGADGEIEFDIYGYRVYDESTDIWTEITIPDLRIKSMRLSVTDKDGNPVDLSDYDYVSKLDSRYSNAGEDVKLYHGTNVTGYPIQRGNLMLLSSGGDYLPISALNKAGDTDLPERLLLRSIKSNYGGANVVLTADIPPLFGYGYLTYASYLSGKKLAILKNRINLSENISTVTLRELHEDTATIL